MVQKISIEDLKWEGKDPGISLHGVFGGPNGGMSRPPGRDHAPGSGRGRGLTKSQSRKDFPPSQNGIGKKGPDDIQSLHTDTLIKEVERVFGAARPNPVEIERANEVLKEHELALSEAIARLVDLSEGESEFLLLLVLKLPLAGFLIKRHINKHMAVSNSKLNLLIVVELPSGSLMELSSSMLHDFLSCLLVNLKIRHATVGKGSLDEIANSWKSSHSDILPEENNAWVLEDYGKWITYMSFSERVSWVVGGMVLTTSLLFVRSTFILRNSCILYVCVVSQTRNMETKMDNKFGMTILESCNLFNVCLGCIYSFP